MKRVTFLGEGSRQPGLLDVGQVVTLRRAGFNDVLSLIAGGEQSPDRARAQVSNESTARLDLGPVILLASLANPPRIFGVDLNYRGPCNGIKDGGSRCADRFSRASLSDHWSGCRCASSARGRAAGL